MPRKYIVRREFDTFIALSAACAAYRVIGSYIKQVSVESLNDHDSVHKATNREMTHKFLLEQENITDADREFAEKLKSYWNGKTFKLLTGEYMSDFDRNILTLLQKETVTEGYDVAIMASLPSSYIAGIKREEHERRVKFSQGGYIGSIGERIKINIEVLKCVYSKKWFTYFITGITPDDQAVFFSYKEEMLVGSVLNIAGTVKRQDNNQTQLNRVKVL